MNAPAHDTYPAPAHGWTCFHCGETFTQMQRARDHFGRTPDAMPGCVIKAGEELGLLMELRRTEDARDEMGRQRDAANDEAESLASQLSAWKTLFPGCVTARDLFNKFDSMEGRALAAEEAARLAVSHLDMQSLKISHCKHHERLEPWLTHPTAGVARG